MGRRRALASADSGKWNACPMQPSTREPGWNPMAANRLRAVVRDCSAKLPIGAAKAGLNRVFNKLETYGNPRL